MRIFSHQRHPHTLIAYLAFAMGHVMQGYHLTGSVLAADRHGPDRQRLIGSIHSASWHPSRIRLWNRRECIALVSEPYAVLCSMFDRVDD